MDAVNVYERYFTAELTANGVERRAAKVYLTVESGGGHVRYEACVTFFPHRDEEDYAVSYDACYTKVLFDEKGRRSKNRDRLFLSGLKEEINALSEEAGGTVYWDRPLRAPRFG